MASSPDVVCMDGACAPGMESRRRRLPEQASAEEWVPKLRKTVRQERHMAWTVLMHPADVVRAIALQLALVWRI